MVSEIQWSDKNGEKHRKNFSGQKKTIVKNKLDEFKKQLIISSGDIASKDVVFQDFAEYWFTSVLKNKLKPTSYAKKEVTLENQVYPYLGGIPINQITYFDIQNMINSLSEKELSYSTIKKHMKLLMAVLKNIELKPLLLLIIVRA